MTILDAPEMAPQTTSDVRITRSANNAASVLTLRNGEQVQLIGSCPAMYFPPNYLDDLRAGKL